MLYADDIILSAPSVKALQLLLEVCEHELDSLDMFINARKSYCIRIGPRFNIDCHPLVTRDNRELKWCGSIRYLDAVVKLWGNAGERRSPSVFGGGTPFP